MGCITSASSLCWNPQRTVWFFNHWYLHFFFLLLFSLALWTNKKKMCIEAKIIIPILNSIRWRYTHTDSMLFKNHKNRKVFSLYLLKTIAIKCKVFNLTVKLCRNFFVIHYSVICSVNNALLILQSRESSLPFFHQAKKKQNTQKQKTKKKRRREKFQSFQYHAVSWIFGLELTFWLCIWEPSPIKVIWMTNDDGKDGFRVISFSCSHVVIHRGRFQVANPYEQSQTTFFSTFMITKKTYWHNPHLKSVERQKKRHGKKKRNAKNESSILKKNVFFFIFQHFLFIFELLSVKKNFTIACVTLNVLLSYLKNQTKLNWFSF